MSLKNHFYFLLLAVIFLSQPAFAQEFSTLPSFKDVVLKIDTTSYRFSTHAIQFNSETQLAFPYSHEDQVAEVSLIPSSPQIQSVRLARSADYELLDSVVNVNNSYFRFKIRFKNL